MMISSLGSHRQKRKIDAYQAGLTMRRRLIVIIKIMKSWQKKWRLTVNCILLMFSRKYTRLMLTMVIRLATLQQTLWTRMLRTFLFATRLNRSICQINTTSRYLLILSDKLARRFLKRHLGQWLLQKGNQFCSHVWRQETIILTSLILKPCTKWLKSRRPRLTNMNTFGDICHWERIQRRISYTYFNVL